MKPVERCCWIPKTRFFCFPLKKIEEKPVGSKKKTNEQNEKNKKFFLVN